MARHSPHILELARKGAESRFRELMQEVSLLLHSFPDLHDSFDPDELPIKFLVARAAGQPPREPSSRRRHRRMSPVARRAVSERIKKYWAARRASTNK